MVIPSLYCKFGAHTAYADHEMQTCVCAEPVCVRIQVKSVILQAGVVAPAVNLHPYSFNHILSTGWFYIIMDALETK